MSSAGTKKCKKKDTHEHTSLRSQSNQGNTASGAYTWSSLPAGKPSYSWSWKKKHTNRAHSEGQEPYRRYSKSSSMIFCCYWKVYQVLHRAGVKHLRRGRQYLRGDSLGGDSSHLFSWMPTINFNGAIKTFTVRWLQSDPGSHYSTDICINKDIYFGLQTLGSDFGWQ